MTQRRNLPEFFRDYFDSPAEYLIYDDGYRRWNYSFRESARRAQVFRERLRDAGVGGGDRVLLWSENRPEWIFAFWGCLLAEAIVVPIGNEASAEFVHRVQGIVEPKVVVLGDDVQREDESDSIPEWRLSAIDWNGFQPSMELPQTSGEDLAEIVFTSGSTGTPKGVKLSHGNLLSQVNAVEPAAKRYRPFTHLLPRLRMLQMLPLSHMFGQATTLLLPPMIPCSVTMMRQQSPAAVIEQIRARRIEAVVCVPRVLELLRNLIKSAIPESEDAGGNRIAPPQRLWKYRRIHSLFGWQFAGFLVGGAALDRALEDFWANLGYFVIQGYGLTETSPVVTLNHPLLPRRGSVGTTLPNVEIRISEDREILVRGPNVMAGYYKDEEKTAETLDDGWLHTGDLGEVDEDGYLSISGRKKEVIVTPEGVNVFPQDLERVLDSLDGIHESAVVGIPSKKDDAQVEPHAVLVTDDGLDAQAAVEEANRQLQAGHRIRDFTVWPDAELPRTEGTRKLKRRAIQERLEAEREEEPEGQESGGSSEGDCQPDLVRKQLEQRLGRNLSGDTKLDELGLSSIDQLELVLELEQQCQVVADEEELGAASTVEELESIVERMKSDEGQRHAIGRGMSDFPLWSRALPARAVRRAGIASLVIPFTRIVARPKVRGVEHLDGLHPPMLFAANHLSNLDTPLILAALPSGWRHRIAPAAYKERFRAHFAPREHTTRERARSSLEYGLVTLFFNAFPIPQEEPGARRTLRYAGDLVSEGWSLLIFPEGQREPGTAIASFMPGVGLMASRLRLPVVPIRIRNSDEVLPPGRIVPQRGTVDIRFGPRILPEGHDPEKVTERVEEAVRAL